MIEQNTVGGVDAISLPIVYGNPVGINLSRRIGRTRIEWGVFVLRNFPHFAEHLRGRGLIEASRVLAAEDPQCFQ